MQVVIALDTLTVFSSDSSKQTENCITIRLKAVSPLIVFAGCLLPHGKSSQQFQNEGVTSALFKEMRADIYCSLKQLLYSASVIGPLQQLSLKFKSNKDSYDFVYGYLVTTQDVQTKDTGKEEIWQQLNTVNQCLHKNSLKWYAGCKCQCETLQYSTSLQIGLERENYQLFQ